ncbi:hypothetical protein PRIPAC_87865 [Pristionchus pacificus]|uniref:Protein kinase domain-containing protein n=1 Tax=Pristionchus pacificus TaxID=54126 RepID=A0A2A6CWE9_PRIPA|nr:hypothetical protein PRIPAC_87865 [Pristionchus pacificus]|eukprot:PDM82367.1 protein kinase [Pristionchus pacificus]
MARHLIGNMHTKEDMDEFIRLTILDSNPELYQEIMKQSMRKAATKMRRQLEKRKKEEAVSEIELEDFEPLPEDVECYKLENGAKRFFKITHPQQFYISETLKADLSIANGLLTFAGEMNNSLYFYTSKRIDEFDEENEEIKYVFYKIVCPAENEFSPILHEIREIVTLSRTEFALRQPYFLDVDHRVVQDFEGNTFGLPSGNIALTTATRDDFRFFVCGEIVYFINSGSYEIDIVNRGKFVTIVLEDDMELPESIYAKPNCPIYLMHGNVLMTIKDNLLHKLQYLDDLYTIAGMEGDKLFLNVSGLSCSMKVEAPTVEKEESNGFSSTFVNDYDVKSIRGHGGFGYVFEAANKHDQWIYAVKRIAVDKKDLERGRREAQSMVRLEHPGIVRYFHSWVEQPPEGWQHEADARLLESIGWSGDRLKFNEGCVFIYIKMQLCGESLANWLENNQEQSTRVPARMRAWFRQIVAAVGYIHDCNIIHRDLKTSNILFMDEDYLKVCDLGIATERFVNDDEETAFSRTSIGTNLYQSPELRDSLAYSSKSDVFALGLILAELCMAMTDFEREEIFNNYRDGIQHDLLGDAETAEFISMLTAVRPNNRLSCREMLAHQYLSSN